MSYIGNSPKYNNVDTYSSTGDGTTVNFTLSWTPPSQSAVLVFVNGVNQRPGTDFTVLGTTLTFTSAPAVGVSIFVYAIGQIGTVNTVSDGSITTPKLADSSVTGAKVLFGTNDKMRGDFSNATASSRSSFQTSTTNGNTNVPAVPNGTATTAGYRVHNSSDVTNYAYGTMIIDTTSFAISSLQNGTGTLLPLVFKNGASEAMRIETTGAVGVGTAGDTGLSGQTIVSQGSTTTAKWAGITGRMFFVGGF